MAETKTKTETDETEFELGVADEVPPVRREKTASKYDPVFEHAREIAPKASIVKAADRSKATSIAAYLRRVSDEDEFNVEQRLSEVYVQYISK